MKTSYENQYITMDGYEIIIIRERGADDLALHLFIDGEEVWSERAAAFDADSGAYLLKRLLIPPSLRTAAIAELDQIAARWLEEHFSERAEMMQATDRGFVRWFVGACAVWVLVLGLLLWW